MEHYFDMDFHLFDGEGTGGGEGVQAAADMQSEPKQDVTQIQYGRSAGEGQAQGNVSTGGQATDLNAEFAALVGKDGRYHDIYDQHVSRALQQRFKNQADLSGQIDKITDDLSTLFMNYGLKSGDFEGLKTAIANDDSLYRSGAERAGLDVDQYKENLQLKRDAERGRQITEAYEQQQRQNEMFSRWEQEAEALRQNLPNFDLGFEIENNETFARLIYNGVDVPTAFRATHSQQIDSIMENGARRQAQQDVWSNLQRRSARPSEGALGHAPAIMRKSDPSQLSNDDLDEINRRVANGESISF